MNVQIYTVVGAVVMGKIVTAEMDKQTSCQLYPETNSYSRFFTRKGGVKNVKKIIYLRIQ